MIQIHCRSRSTVPINSLPIYQDGFGFLKELVVTTHYMYNGRNNGCNVLIFDLSDGSEPVSFALMVVMISRQ